jgi:hypothetical protein
MIPSLFSSLVETFTTISYIFNWIYIILCMSIFQKLFRSKPSKQETENKKLPTLEEFPHLNSDNRLEVIMIVGDSGNLDYLPFLKYAILNDADIDVKFAALKRIHLFNEHPHTISMLLELKDNGEGEKLEPYFSMALSRVGIISLEEFKDRINNTQH